MLISPNILKSLKLHQHSPFYQIASCPTSCWKWQKLEVASFKLVENLEFSESFDITPHLLTKWTWRKQKICLYIRCSIWLLLYVFYYGPHPEQKNWQLITFNKKRLRFLKFLLGYFLFWPPCKSYNDSSEAWKVKFYILTQWNIF